MSVLALAAATSNAIAFTDLHLSPVALDLGFFQLRWYSLAYLAGIFIGYWYLLKLLKQPGAPMARRHPGFHRSGGDSGVPAGVTYLKEHPSPPRCCPTSTPWPCSSRPPKPAT